MTEKRVDVTLRALGDEEGELMREWVHYSGYEEDELGVRLDWGDDGYVSFFPWSSVLRVDFDPHCKCVDCEEARKK